MQSPESPRSVPRHRSACLLLLALAFTAGPAAFAQTGATMDAPDLTGKTSNERFRTGPQNNPGISAEAIQRGPETDEIPGPPRRPTSGGLDLGSLLPFLTLAIGASSIGVAMYMKKSKPA